MGRKATLQEIADAIGLVERSSVRELIAKGMPQSVEGAKEWHAENIRGGRPASNASEDSSYQKKLKHEAECKRIEAARRGLEFRRMMGKLVERDVVDRWVSKAFARVRSRLESIPDELAATVEPGIRSQVAADHRERIRLILLELAEMGKEFDE